MKQITITDVNAYSIININYNRLNSRVKDDIDTLKFPVLRIVERVYNDDAPSLVPNLITCADGH
jgi:hypothetical protein